MSTANKLTYLNGTKQAIKQAINEDFEVIDNNTTFREYAEEISSNNAKYKDLIPKETKNATNTLDISNSSGLDKALVTQYGNTYQEGEPNPDYPQEIVNISGKSTLKDAGKNLCDYDNNTDYSPYYLNNNGNWINGGSNHINQKINITSNIISIYIGAKTGDTYIRLGQFKSDGTFITRTLINGSTNNITLNSNCSYIWLSTDKNKSNYFTNVSVIYGNSISAYEPYQEQSYDLDLKSRNLFDISTITKNTYIDDRGYTGSSQVSNLSDYIELKPNASYTLSYDYSTLLNSTERYFVYYDENKTNISGLTYSSINKTSTFTTPNNAKYLRFSYDKNCNSIMLNEGSTIQAYELFYDINLCKISTYKDRIYPLNGKWYLNKQIGKVVLDGSESWTYASNLEAFYISDYIGKITNDDIGAYSNKYLAVSRNNYNASNYTIYGNNINILSIRDTDYTSVSTFRTYLQTANVIVYYILKKPTTTEITENNYPTLYNQLNNIKLYEGVNHITMTNESGLDVEFDITYYKDWKLD